MKVDHVPRKIMCFPNVLYVYLGVTNSNRLGLYSSRSPSQDFFGESPGKDDQVTRGGTMMDMSLKTPRSGKYCVSGGYG